MAQAAAAASTPSRRRSDLFTLPELWNTTQRENEYARQHGIHDRGDPDNNMKRLYSATGFNAAWTVYQQKMLDTVNRKIAERGIEGSLKDIAVMTARNPAEASLFNHASMGYNNDFFFRGLSFRPDVPIPAELNNALIRDFGSIEGLKQEMLAMADAMFGPGFVWLVLTSHDRGMPPKFMLLATYLAGSPLVGAHNRRQPLDMNTQNVAGAVEAGGAEGLSRAQYPQHLTPQNSVGSFGQYSRRSPSAPGYGGVGVTPCLCVNTWEHAYMYDWKFSKKLFLERWWSFIDWERVSTIADVRSHKANPMRSAYERTGMMRRG